MFRLNLSQSVKRTVTQLRFNSSPAYNGIVANFRSDLKKAMIAKKTLERDTIKNILSAIKNDEIDGHAKNEFELLRIYKSLIKQRTKAIETYEKGDRMDLAQKEIDEIEVIQRYVEQLPIASEEELKAKIQNLLLEKYPSGSTAPKTSEVMQLCAGLAESWNSNARIVKALVNKEVSIYFKK